jgi:Holliday junction resolvasome RuvABC endonuclease subunit
MGRGATSEGVRIMSLLQKLHSGTVLSIDPSTKSLAFAVVRRDKDHIKLISKGKINFHHLDDLVSKLRCINHILPMLIDHHKPDMVVIEQTIYIQNPQTSRLLSYIVGHMLGLSLQYNIKVHDVGPLEWKRWLGYKSVSKSEITAWILELGEKEAKKKASFERKNRVKNILEEKIPTLIEEDYDILDAIAIGVWASNILL